MTASPIDLALGRHCHFCDSRTVRNVRLRRQQATATPETLTVPLCARHRALLAAAAAAGRLHRPTGVRWWLAEMDAGAGAGGAVDLGCPVSALLPPR